VSQSAIDIEGLEAVRRAFKELEPRLARKVLRQAEKKAAKLFSEEIKIHTPEATGNLKRTIKIRSSKGPRGSKRGQVSVAVLVGQAGGMAAAGAVKRAWYAYLQEKGWTLGKRERAGGKVTGYGPAHGNLGAAGVRRIPGKFFTRRALHSKETPARIQLISEIAQGIEREAKALSN
jgi:Bacteriophage HK97-gp10, putative tail-component